MKNRIELHEKLVEVLASKHVYFQPPDSVKLTYPCIIYHLSKPSVRHANNKMYLKHKNYTITVIDKNPDSLLPDKLLESFEYISEDRRFFADNLNHTVFSLFY